jgi:phosphatidylglycerol:prolipoprotein diacylglycerol transferase
MSPVLFRWRSYSLYWYSALIWLGIVLAIAYAQWRGRLPPSSGPGRAGTNGDERRGYRHQQVLDAALCVLVGGLVGARLAYVLPNWQDYGGRVSALIGLWGGGYAFQGGLLGGTVALWLYSLRAGQSFPRLADLAAPAVALAQALGWAGAWVHGANYGLVMRSPFSMWLPDLYGVYGPRFPTQMLACALSIVLFLGLHRLSQLHLPHRTRDGVPTPAGRLALLYLLGNGLGHFLLEFTRADDAPYWGLLRWTQVAALAEVAVAIALLLYLRYRRRKRSVEVAE